MKIYAADTFSFNLITVSDKNLHILCDIILSFSQEIMLAYIIFFLLEIH